MQIGKNYKGLGMVTLTTNVEVVMKKGRRSESTWQLDFVIIYSTVDTKVVGLKVMFNAGQEKEIAFLYRHQFGLKTIF